MVEKQEEKKEEKKEVEIVEEVEEKEHEAYVCEFCGKAFSSKQEKASHIRWQHQGMSAEDMLEKYLQEARKLIDAKLNEILSLETHPRLRELFEYTLEGGKRFRPSLTLLVGDVLGVDRKLCLEYAALVEIIHAATLVHDDVIDEDEIRRGRPSLWKLVDQFFMGNLSLVDKLMYRVLKALPFKKRLVLLDPYKVSILLGDSLLAFVHKLIKDPKVIDVIGDAIYALAKGAVKEFFETVSNPDDYRELVKGKTAALFALSFHLPAIHCGDPELEEACRKAGRCLGEVYQFVDDLAEGEVPKGINIKELIEDAAMEYRTHILKLPESVYRDLLLECVTYMANKMFEQEESKYRLVWDQQKERYVVGTVRKKKR
ncbi:MAG: polyprenyl synthetase family protein [Candidatus Methanosuratincola petrocarbonis]